MNKAGIAVSTLVTLAVAGTAGAWYTGTQLEGVLQTSIERGNQQLRAQFPDTAVALELAGFERGFFSSQARYRVVLQAAEDDNVGVDLFVTDRIEHGPLPLSRLASFQWFPVMAVSHAQLEPSEQLAGLFAASAGRPPVSVLSNIGYGNSVYGELEVAPLSWTSERGSSVSFSGLAAVYETDTAGDAVKLNGRVDSMELKGRPGLPDSGVSLVGWDMSVDRQRDASGIYLGSSRGELDQFVLAVNGMSPLILTEVLQSDLVTLDTDGANMAMNYRIGAVNYGADKLGSMELGLTASRLDPQAIQKLTGLYGNVMFSDIASLDGQLDTLAAQLQEAAEQLLDGHPRLSLDNLAIKTANGESRLSLGVDLERPASLELATEKLIPQLIRHLDAKLVLSKPMLKDVVRYKALFDPSLDRQAVEQEAAMAVEMAGAMAEMLQLGRVDGDNIISQLSYDNGAVLFNGQAMELEELMGVLGGTR